jgi:hypothetical protein
MALNAVERELTRTIVCRLINGENASSTDACMITHFTASASSCDRLWYVRCHLTAHASNGVLVFEVEVVNGATHGNITFGSSVMCVACGDGRHVVVEHVFGPPHPTQQAVSQAAVRFWH